MEPRRQPALALTPHLMFGLLFIFIGVVFTLDQLNIAPAEEYLRYWPAGLIILGLAKLWQTRGGHGNPIGGVIFIAVGTWMLLDSLRLIRVGFDFWPLLLIFVGGMIVWQGLRGRRQRGATNEQDTINAVAILSGVKRSSHSASFRGGELTAFMGGCEVDLRHAAVNGDAVIDVFAMWGGIVILVPENWTIIGHLTPIMGGFEDQTANGPQTASPHRLTVRGMVLMGGVEIKN
jgi:predicted membrane protein